MQSIYETIIYENKMKVNKSNWINNRHISSFPFLKSTLAWGHGSIIFDKGIKITNALILSELN